MNPGADDFSPKPPDRCTTMQSFSEPIESWYEEENYSGGESWQEPDYTHLEEESYAEPPPQRNESKPLAHTSRVPWSYTYHHSFRATYKDQTRLFYDNGYNYFGSECFFFDETDYTGWEKNMDTYFWNYSIPNHKKLSISLGQLIGEALKWWDNEEYSRWYYKEPEIKTWEELKLLMCAIHSPKSLMTKQQTISQSNAAIQEDNTAKRVSQGATKQPAIKGKSFEIKHPLELTCYKCKNRGHIAKDCPTKKSVQQELVCAPQENQNQQQHDLKASFNDAQLNCDGIIKSFEQIERMILSLQAGKNAGTKGKMEHQLALIQKQAQNKRR